MKPFWVVLPLNQTRKVFATSEQAEAYLLANPEDNVPSRFIAKVVARVRGDTIYDLTRNTWTDVPDDLTN